MQRAATGLATVCIRLLGRSYGVRVTALVGAGNNGGDALFAAAALAARGARVTAVLLAPDRAHPAGLAALRRAGGRVVEPGDEDGLDRADLVLDGIVGIGGARQLRPAAAELVARAAAGPGLMVAVDVPSGVDAATGAVVGEAFPAQHTVTFGAVKPGLVVGAGRGCAGTVHLVDIGLAEPGGRGGRGGGGRGPPGGHGPGGAPATAACPAAPRRRRRRPAAPADGGGRQVLPGRRRRRRRVGHLPGGRRAVHRGGPAH